VLERGPYGIEWTPRPKDEDAPRFRGIVWLVVVVAFVSLSWTLFRRYRDRVADEQIVTPAPAPVSVESRPQRPSLAVEPAAAVPAAPYSSSLAKRPARVRNLLMRLEEAERQHDVEMAVTTIEQLRALPGEPAADLDNALARRLGLLNVRLMFGLKSAQWVSTVKVGPRQMASRIAAEYGSTFASLVKLNPGVDLERVRVGQQLYVLNHPRFNLVVRTRPRTADLQLNGKFFRRYDLLSAPKVPEGAYEWRDVELGLKATDRAELDMLLPKATSVLVSEM